MKRFVLLLAALAAFSQVNVVAQPFSGPGDARPLIQIAILLDTSNSMDGLINQAKSQLWKIVAETGRARRDGFEPRLEVALYEYGNDSLPMLSGYIRRVIPFTSDLDLISEYLFSLDTNGGSEFAGRAMQTALRELDWSRDRRSLRLMYIAGNEPFNQGLVDYYRTAVNARERGIIVNTIFCGDYSEGVRTSWDDGARAGGGSYLNIDSDFEHAYIQAPQDERLRQLNLMLNDTYLGYGESGEQKMQLQEAQDDNASGMGMGSLLERARVKSTSSYSNSEWDLVDAYAEGELSMDELPAEQLPPQMQQMSAEEREAYVLQKRRERADIQAEIQRLSQERDAYIAGERAAMEEEQTLDTAIIQTLRNAAVQQGFVFE